MDLHAVRRSIWLLGAYIAIGMAVVSIAFLVLAIVEMTKGDEKDDDDTPDTLPSPPQPFETIFPSPNGRKRHVKVPIDPQVTDVVRE